MSRRPSGSAEALRTRVQQFARAFGFLGDSHTPCGLPLNTSHAHALMILFGAADGLHQAALGRELGIDKSNASRLVRQLARRGHVVVTPTEDDGRLKRVRLTAKGARLAAAVDAASRRRFAELLAAIARSRRRIVLLGLEQLTRALERSRSPSRPHQRKRA